MDIVGYNYMQARYEMDTKAHPNRVIVGSETHPREIAELWGLVKRYENIIGDFSWVGWNYLGEAGIGRNNYGEMQDLTTSYLGEYPWIGSACGDHDITGRRLPISYYREIVYGLRKDPYIAVMDPLHYGEPVQESPWGWADSTCGWTWTGYEGKPVQVSVFADADEVVLYQDGCEIGRAVCGEEQKYKALFETIYRPGTLCAVSFRDGEVIGEFTLETASGEAHLSAEAEEGEIVLSEETLAYIDISIRDDEGRIFHTADPLVTVSVEGPGELLGFGSGATVTEERYDDAVHTPYEGELLLIIRPSESGVIRVHVSAEGYGDAEAEVTVREA